MLIKIPKVKKPKKHLDGIYKKPKPVNVGVDINGNVYYVTYRP